MELYTGIAIEGDNLVAPINCTDSTDNNSCTWPACLNLCYDNPDCIAAVWHFNGTYDGPHNGTFNESCVLKSSITSWNNTECWYSDNSTECWEGIGVKCNYNLSTIIEEDQFAKADYIYTGGML